VHGIADELGVDVQTVRRWIQSGRLRAFKPGKEYRVREADLEEFLAAREVRPKGSAPSPLEPSLFKGLEEERRRLRVQLLRELKEHAASLASRYRQDLAQLTARRGSSAEWERLERESAFASIGTHYLLQDGSGAPEGLQSEPERRVWRAAHKAGQDLDAVCNDIEAAAASAREVAGLEESEGLRALDAYRRRAG
jgi:excisionase family DNA binding protein